LEPAGPLAYDHEEISPEVRFGFVLAMTATAIWLANRAIGPALNADSGLYHFTSVRWATSYPIVPGLGNLHYRLAFNSSYFLYVASLDIGAWAHESHHLANGFLLLGLLTQILLSVVKLVGRVEHLKVYEIFDIVLLPSVRKRLWALTSLVRHQTSPYSF
jgi:hypothetical protein